MSKPTGGPAYPSRWGREDVHTGMTLRDYFAAAALQGQLSGMYAFDAGASLLAAVSSTQRSPEQIMAKGAYQYADAMLSEREK